MRIGVPKEIKDNENRVALTPAGVNALTAKGHEVSIQKSAGVGSGIDDDSYVQAGAKILPTAKDVFDFADMIIKVKEPLEQEYDFLRENQLLFTYLHLAPAPELTKALLKRKVPGVAYETIQTADGRLPLLKPMSEVAGRMSVQAGAQYLESPRGGRGVLLSGVPGVPSGVVVIVGGGTVGINAAKVAVGYGADVTIIDNNADRLAYLDDIFGSRISTLMSNPYNIAQAVKRADVAIGAALIPGAKCAHLITEDMVKTMKPGSVIVDVAIDQGGSVQTVDRATTHSNPTYVKYGVTHYAVANIPGAVARTSTFALTNVTLPYAIKLADLGLKNALKADASLIPGVNTLGGHCTHRAVADSLSLPYVPLDKALTEYKGK